MNHGKSTSQKPNPSNTLRGSNDAPPAAPWHPFPLVELCVLAGLVLLGFGVFSLQHKHGAILVTAGVVVASLAGLETAAREHFTRFRSHSFVLAGIPAVAAAATAYFLHLSRNAIAGAAVGVLGICAYLLRRQFRRD